MKHAIIIVSHENGMEQTRNLLNTIDTTYPVIIVTNPASNSSYEMLGIKTAIEYGIDEFILLQSTIEIKDNKIFDIIFENYQNNSVFMNPFGHMFLNKYRLDIITQLKLPIVKTKRDAIYAELNMHKAYRKLEVPVIFDENFVDNSKREHKFGRVNMVIENDYIKKYKGTWTLGMIRE